MLFIIVLLFTGAVGYPSGAPEEACSSHVPQHGALPQTTIQPYSITTNLEENIFSITILADNENFALWRGLLITLRNTKGSIIGKVAFYDSSEYRLECEYGVTHTNNTEKSNGFFAWKVEDEDRDDISIFLTIVYDIDTFWILKFDHSLPTRLEVGTSSVKLTETTIPMLSTKPPKQPRATTQQPPRETTKPHPATRPNIKRPVIRKITERPTQQTVRPTIRQMDRRTNLFPDLGFSFSPFREQTTQQPFQSRRPGFLAHFFRVNRGSHGLPGSRGPKRGPDRFAARGPRASYNAEDRWRCDYCLHK